MARRSALVLVCTAIGTAAFAPVPAARQAVPPTTRRFGKPMTGIVWDLDGCVTATARLHGIAWAATFNEYLKLRVADGRDSEFVEFEEPKDYLTFVDGKPRMDGVKCFLDSRGIDIPFGAMDDEPGKDTICGVGNLKNAEFLRQIDLEADTLPFQSSLDIIAACKEKGLHTGLATSSRNADAVLDATGLGSLFESKIDGIVAYDMKMPGKPAPDIFVNAAQQMGCDPRDCVCIEDATVGVRAGKDGNFGLVVGIAREVTKESLLEEGADYVVTDMDETSLEEMSEWFEKGKGRDKDGWLLKYYGHKAGEETLRETLTSTANGYMGTRGADEAAPLGNPLPDQHYPGTYLAGVFNKVDSDIAGRAIPNNDMVNCANWLPLAFKLEGDAEYAHPLSSADHQVSQYEHTLDMQTGVTSRSYVVEDSKGRRTRVASSRFVSLASPHLCGVKLEVSPLNHAGRVKVRSAVDGSVVNDNCPRYRDLEKHHMNVVSATDGGAAGIALVAETSVSKYQVATSAKATYVGNGAAARAFVSDAGGGVEQGVVAEELTFAAREGESYAVEKLVAIHTSLDPDRADAAGAAAAAEASLAAAGPFSAVLGAHTKAWAAAWDVADIEIEGDRYNQRIARLHAYHMIGTASPVNAAMNLDAGMPARGLTGESYRGHIFWDELYIQPMYLRTMPDVAKSLLMYRFNRLPAARAYAAANGYRGAMYPWQTADDGGEETQEVHFNPADGTWGPDDSRRQRHVSIAVFYNVWAYVQATGDTAFFDHAGAEIMFDIAQFWVSAADLDSGDGKFHIAGVMGPDEFHEGLPGADEHGIRDNAYTNVMVSWLLEKCTEMLAEHPEGALQAMAKVGVTAEDVGGKWTEVKNNLAVSLSDEGILEQFQGYFGLEEHDWAKYEGVGRADRALKADGKSPDDYKVAKQADTLMMFYVLGADETSRVLTNLGYDVGDPTQFLAKNYAYYEQRTSHGSTLSKVVHALLSSCGAGDDSTTWDWFSESMASDIADTQGGTTTEGIHCGVMAGTLDVIAGHYAGIDTTAAVMKVAPKLPKQWTRLALTQVHRGVTHKLQIEEGAVSISSDVATEVAVNGQVVALPGGGKPLVVPM